MNDILKGYVNNSTSLKKWHKKSIEKQRRKWTIQLFIIVLVLIGSPIASLGNDMEPLLWEVEKEQKVILHPALCDISPGQDNPFILRVNLRMIPQKPDRCLENAYIKVFNFFEGPDIKNVFLKISLAKVGGSPSKEQDKGIPPTGRAIVQEPVSGSSIEVRIEEANEEDFTAFLQELPSKKMEEVKQGLGRRYWIVLEMKNPEEPEICLQVGIEDTRLIPLR